MISGDLFVGYVFYVAEHQRAVLCLLVQPWSSILRSSPCSSWCSSPVGPSAWPRRFSIPLGVLDAEFGECAHPAAAYTAQFVMALVDGNPV